MKQVEEVFKKLNEPFKPEDIEWRIGRKSKDKKKATALAYMNARAVEERLDEAVGPENWTVSYEPIDMGTVNQTELRWENGQHVEKEVVKVYKGFVCTIQIKCLNEDNEVITITRSDGANCTDFEAFKGGLSGAFKRAAAKFGIGRYLYNLKESWVEINQYGSFVQVPVLPQWALPEGYVQQAKPVASEHKQSDNNAKIAFDALPPVEEWDDVPIPDDDVFINSNETVGTAGASEPVMERGKYAGMKVCDIQDKGYLAWIYEKSNFPLDIKQAAQRVLGA